MSDKIKTVYVGPGWALFKVINFIVWVLGFILAKGFWWSVLAFLVVFYDWHLVIKHFAPMVGLDL